MARSPKPPPSTVWVPWFFSGFLLSNILLSYFSFSLQAKLWVGLFGVLLPFALALRHFPPVKFQDFLRKEFLPPVPAWAWVGLALAAAFVRFYRLTTLSVWPNYDDGLWGFFAINFMHHWDWSIFYQDNSYPSAYAWGLTVFFKIFGPSLWTLWLYPAFLSLLLVPVGYAAVRRVFSRSFSFLLAVFLGLSFWPVFVGRFGNQQVLTLLWECLWFWALGGFWKTLGDPKPGAVRAIALGAVTALGFYIYISWAAVAFFTLFTVAGLALARRRSGPRQAAWFLAALGLFLAPILRAGLLHNYGRIVHDIGALHGGVSFSDRLLTAGGYVSSLFWEMPPGHFSYQPVWGGLLDPLVGALFLLGLLAVLRAWREPFCLWLLSGLVLFFVPGILTHDVEPFRNLPMIPLLGVVCGVGAVQLTERLARSRRGAVLLVLALVSGGVNFYHLAVRYHDLWDQESAWKGYAKPMERYRAFEILDRIQKEKGPGLVFSNFTAGLCDQTLSVADHAFNAAENSDLDPGHASWSALLANANDKPFLERRFPGGEAYYLSKGLDSPDGGEMLWVMPVAPAAGPEVERWRQANLAFCCFPGRYNGILRDNLMGGYPAFQGDPFLESCYWEKLADLDFRVSLFQDTLKPIEDLEKGIKRGLPAAHLYYRLAMFHLMRSEKAQAKACLQQALAAPLDLTSAGAQLHSLEASP